MSSVTDRLEQSQTHIPKCTNAREAPTASHEEQQRSARQGAPASRTGPISLYDKLAQVASPLRPQRPAQGVHSVSMRDFLGLTSMLLALVAAEAAVVAEVLALRLGLLLPLLLVRSLLATAVAACALGGAAVAHWGAAVACRGITLRAAEVSRLSPVLACISISLRNFMTLVSCCETYLHTAGRKSVFRGIHQGSANFRERKVEKDRTQLACPCPTARKGQIVYDTQNEPGSRLTLHLRGRPLTLYPFIWQMAMAAFS